MSASNCQSARWDTRLTDIQTDPLKWSELIKMEVSACSEPGSLDLRSHLISVAEKQEKMCQIRSRAMSLSSHPMN